MASVGKARRRPRRGAEIFSASGAVFSAVVSLAVVPPSEVEASLGEGTSDAVWFDGLTCGMCFHAMAPFLQFSMQFMQTTHRLASIVCVSISIQADLHRFSQARHWVHLDVSIVGLNQAKRERKPKIVPTGQTVLHHVRPPRQAKKPTRPKVSRAMMKEDTLFIQISVA